MRIVMENGRDDMPNYQKSSGLPPKMVSTPGQRIKKIARTVSKRIP